MIVVKAGESIVANIGPIYPYTGVPAKSYSPIVRIYSLKDHSLFPPPLLHQLLLPLLPLFIPKSAFSSKLPSFRERRDQVEISVDTYSSAHCDPTMISRVLVSLKEISLLPVPVTPF